MTQIRIGWRLAGELAGTVLRLATEGTRRTKATGASAHTLSWPAPGPAPTGAVVVARQSKGSRQRIRGKAPGYNKALEFLYQTKAQAHALPLVTSPGSKGGRSLAVEERHDGERRKSTIHYQARCFPQTNVRTSKRRHPHRTGQKNTRTPPTYSLPVAIAGGERSSTNIYQTACIQGGKGRGHCACSPAR